MSEDRYAVFGDPVAHSWSPRIHAAFAEQTGEQLRYDAIQVPAAAFDAAVAGFFAEGGAGLNITLPHKQSAFRLARTAADAAAAAGAANTLWQDAAGDIACDNTDGRGLVRDLVHNHRVDLRGRSVLLLGAGGAARSVLGSLLEEGVGRLHIANRTAARAQELQARFAGLADVTAGGLDALASEAPFDVVISAMSAGLHGALPDLPAGLLARGACCYDMIYAAEPTAFQYWANGAGADRALDGLGMLVEQAAESFLIWRGVRPETRPVIRMLRQRLL